MLKFIKSGSFLAKQWLVIQSSQFIICIVSFVKKIIIVFDNFIDVYAIEFQKRVLPHTHILIWVASEFKFKTSGDIDSIVSAEIPDRNIDPLCHEII